MERLRPLSEDECYLRCYGSTGFGAARSGEAPFGSAGVGSARVGSAGSGRRGSYDSVRLVPSTTPTDDVRPEQQQAGERLRWLLELRIDARPSCEAG